jgi:hypothetical protein
MLKKITKLLITTSNFIFYHTNVKENHETTNKISYKITEHKTCMRILAVLEIVHNT